MLWLLIACQPECPRFEDLPIEDPQGLASQEQFAGVRQGIEQFATWTGWDGVCVSRVRFVEGPDNDRWNGHYAGRGKRIDLKVGVAASDMPQLIRHELCHAADADLGWISEDHPELFDHGEDIRLYGKRTHERLAEACDVAPYYHPSLPALSACGEARWAASASFVLDNIFTAIPPVEARAGLTYSWSRLEVGDAMGSVGTLPWSDPSPVASDRGVMWMSAEGEGGSARVVLREASWEALEDVTGSVLWTAEDAAFDLDEAQITFRFLSSDGAHVVAAIGAVSVTTGERIWSTHLELDAEGARPFSVPGLDEDQIEAGTLVGDTFWYRPGEDPADLRAIDIYTGEETVDVDAILGARDRVWATPLYDGAVGLGTWDDASTAFTVLSSSGEARTWTAPYRWGPGSGGVPVEGGLLFSATIYPSLEGLGRSGVVRLDDDGGITWPDDLCDESAPGLSRAILWRRGGQLYMVGEEGGLPSVWTLSER